MMPPSILFDARLVLEKPTGIGQYIASILPELTQQAPDWKFYLLRKFHTFAGYNLDALNAPNLSHLISEEPHMSLQQHLTLPRLANKLKVDLLHYPHFDAPVLYQPIPTVATLHDTKYLAHSDFFPSQSRVKQSYMRFLFNSTLKYAKHVLAVSQSTKNDLYQLFPSINAPITITHLAADPSFSPATEPSIQALKKKYKLKRPFILSVGERRPHKNHISLINAYAKSGAKQTHDLIIIGQPYADYRAIETFIIDNELQDRIHLFDDISFEDLIRFYSAAELFVLVSLYEGYGLPVVEAMACGTAVIASNTTALAEITGDGGMQVSPINIDEICQAIDLLIQDKQLNQSWVEKGKRHAQSFSWKKTAQSTLNAYIETLNSMKNC